MIACDPGAWPRAAGCAYGQSVLDTASLAAESPTPKLSSALVDAYFERGDRTAYEAPSRTRRVWIACLTASFLMRSDEASLIRLNGLLRDVCSERSWVYPAHYHHQDASLREPPGEHNTYIDLNSAMTATLLAQVSRLLCGSLDAETRGRVRDECLRRIVRTYREGPPMHWQSSIHNWNPVCHAGVAAAVVEFEPKPAEAEATLDAVTERAVLYLDGFAPDGGCLEGIGYLNYGLSHYCLLASTMESASRDPGLLLQAERLGAIAGDFAVHELSPGRYANFGDAHERVPVSPFLIDYLHRHDIPVAPTPPPSQVDEYQSDLILADLSSLAAGSADGNDDSHTAPRSDSVRPESGRYVLRPETATGGQLSVAVKGGHNGEPHNHNDLGAFIVHYRGESLLCDLGKDSYTRAHFGPERHDILSCSSRGHSVPAIGGKPLGSGTGFRCTSRYANDGDGRRVSLDLTRAYPATAGIRRLGRTVRTAASGRALADVLVVEVDDELLLSEAADVQEVFWSWSPCEVAGMKVVIRSELTTASLESPECWDSVRAEPIEKAVTGAEREKAYRIVFERRACSILHASFRLTLQDEEAR
jgi:hypothetical protein